MNVQLHRNEVSGIIRHFAKSDPARSLQILGDWTRDKWDSTQMEQLRGEAEAIRAMRLAAEHLALTDGGSPEKTYSGLTTQAFEAAKLVAVPAFNGMAGPVVYAFLGSDNFRSYQLKGDELQALPLRENRDLAVQLGNQVTVAVNKKNLDVVVSDYREGETMRVTANNRPERKTTFTHMGPNGWVQSKVKDNVMYEGFVTNGPASLNFDLTAPGQYRCEAHGL